MNIAAGGRLDRYEIRAKIGEGGMGAVFLAEDTSLHRKVALKILPHHLAADKDRLAVLRGRRLWSRRSTIQIS